MEKKKDLQFVMNQGLIIGIVLVVVQFASIALGLTFKTWMGFVGLGINVGLIVWTLYKYKSEENFGLLRYGQGVKIGSLSVVFSGLIVAFFLFLYFTFDPDTYNTLMEEMLTKTEETFLQFGMSEEQVEEMTRETASQSPFQYAISQFFSVSFGGLVLSLIVSAFMKEKGDPFANAMEEIESTPK